MKLLIERHDPETMLFEESEDKKMYISGPFIQMNIVNGNKRRYPFETISPKVEQYIAEKVKRNRAAGELDHPGTPNTSLKNVCIMITELKLRGNDYIGKARVIEEVEKGQTLAGLIRAGLQVGVSTRAFGSVKLDRDGVWVVQDDYMLMSAADVVMDPSAPNALVSAVMESKEWVMENGIIREAQAAVEEQFKPSAKLSSKKITDAARAIIEIINKK